jgi:bifunctional non-homologous end joining protein LigD
LCSDGEGRPDFAALQGKLDGQTRANVVLYAFDLLFLAGEDLRARPLRERRAGLEKLIGKPTSGAIYISEELDVDGATFFKLVSDRGLEGMVSKRIDVPYRSGRRAEWVKTKCVQSEEFVIVGYQPDGRGGIANLKLARAEIGALKYVGSVGTGFSAITMRELIAKLKELEQPQSPIPGLKAKGAIWARPEHLD